MSPDLLSLDDFARSMPTWEDLESIAYRLSKDYIRDTMKTTSQCEQLTEDRDQQNENTMILMQYLLLYKESSYTMNAGDIGWLESTFLPWIWIFNSCGKHKYASELRRYLEDIHFIYPKALRFPSSSGPIISILQFSVISKAIRMNILCNSLGKKGSFRAIDWLVEWNNMFTKVR